jgi:VWFA-related protein
MNKTMQRFSVATKALAWILLFLFGSIAISDGQDSGTADFTIRIAVEEVRIDVVALDRKGRQIADLTPDDFEVYQDNKPVQVVSCKYFTDQKNPSAQPAASANTSKKAAIVPSRRLARDEVRRTFVFIVDDLSMNFSDFHFARMALKNFVEKQMQPGDLIAILRTNYGTSALQLFLSDKVQLLSRINQMPWEVARDLSSDNLFYRFDGQISAIRYCIRALKDMPGRKAMIMLTGQTTMPGGFEVIMGNSTVNYETLYLEQYNRLADDALRAGVVFHLLDIRGLEAPGNASMSGNSFDTFFQQNSDRNAQRRNPLPKKTGGLFIENINFYGSGIGDANDALKGFYLLSYTPPESTFIENNKDIYHRIKIKVKRKGATIYTRDGFYGTPKQTDEQPQERNALRDAIFSPFQNNDLNINLATGYVNDAKSGYQLRSWLHLDAHNLVMTKKAEGYLVSLATVYLTSDANGRIGESNYMKYDIIIKEENLEWVKKQGVRFSIMLPVKKPGAYYVRVAVKDQASDKAGSAYEFINIPDLSKGRLAISNMFILNNNDDATWVRSGATKEQISNLLAPTMQRDLSRSPALRTYAPGESIEYMALVYNANLKDKKPDLESQFILFKDGEEYKKGEPQTVDFDGVADFTRIPIRKKMILGTEMPKGDYVLQLQVKDKLESSKKNSLAIQTLNFVVEPDEKDQ